MSLLRSIKIGDLVLPHNLILAPLAGITNRIFRIICRQEGAALAFTEMISVNGMVREGKNTLALLASSPEDHPLAVQLFGDSPELLARAAMMVSDQAELLDINMGCPVRKVTAAGSGSALLKDTSLVADIIKSVRKATRLPLTVKIRSGWNSGDNAWLQVGRIAEAEGCDAITLHPRSRTQMFSGQANWQQIGHLKQTLKIPVIGSGDLFTPEDCQRMLEETGCDGLMIARGALGNPWIFSQTASLLEGRPVLPVTPQNRAEMAAKHLEMFCTELGEHLAIREIKKHLGWYIHGITGGATLRRTANRALNKQELLAVIEQLGNSGE